MLGASGWASFTLWERTTQASVSATPEADPRLEQLVADGYAHLAADELDVAKEKLNKAVGANASEPRAQEGLVLVAVRRAERRYWEVSLDGAEDKRAQRLEELDHAVHEAREVIANVRRAITDPSTLARIGMAERRLNTMLVVAFASLGAPERAQGALSARLSTHPQRKLLEDFVGVAPKAPAPATSASASASAAVSASAPAPTYRPPTGQHHGYEPHYEFDNEPQMHDKPKTPGELEIPME